MAKRKSKTQTVKKGLIIPEIKYYAYYDQTGNIISVSNEFNTTFENSLEINYDSYKKLVTGEEQFSDYRVGYNATDTEISLFSVFQTKFSFKNEMLEWIDVPPSLDTLLVVEWNNNIKHWVFNVSNECRPFLSSYTKALVFFITLENDFDFLIRTIKIKPESLLDATVYIPFDSTFESNIDKITLTTTKVLKSYGLVITDE